MPQGWVATQPISPPAHRSVWWNTSARQQHMADHTPCKVWHVQQLADGEHTPRQLTSAECCNAVRPAHEHDGSRGREKEGRGAVASHARERHYGQRNLYRGAQANSHIGHCNNRQRYASMPQEVQRYILTEAHWHARKGTLAYSPAGRLQKT